MGLSIYDETAPKIDKITFSLTQGTTFHDIAVAAPLPWRVDALLIASNAAANREIQITMTDVNGPGLLLTCLIPLGAGHTTIPMFDPVATLAPAAIAGWVVPAGYSLQVAMAVVLGAGEFVSFVTLGGFL